MLEAPQLELRVECQASITALTRTTLADNGTSPSEGE